jgi:hypothetical protein
MFYFRCLDKTDLNTYFSAIRCQSEQCHAQNPEIENLEISSVGSMSSLSSGSETENSGFILPIKAQMLGTPWQCNSCSSRKGHRQVIYGLGRKISNNGINVSNV